MKRYAITHTTMTGEDQTLIVTGTGEMIKWLQAIDELELTVVSVILTEWEE